MELKWENISYKYNKDSEYVLKNISYHITQNQRLAIMAPSGYGKTTLLKILAGRIKATSGQVLLNNNPIDKKGISPIQIIFQTPEHSINPKWKLGKTLREIGELDDKTYRELGIKDHWLKRYPNELSSGELQRFCVARALVNGTKFILADEITTMLDPITQAQIWHYLINETTKRNIGMVIVTHDIDLAKKVSTKIISLEDINNKNI